jgi:hypothetical protein
MSYLDLRTADFFVLDGELFEGFTTDSVVVYEPMGDWYVTLYSSSREIHYDCYTRHRWTLCDKRFLLGHSISDVLRLIFLTRQPVVAEHHIRAVRYYPVIGHIMLEAALTHTEISALTSIISQ